MNVLMNVKWHSSWEFLFMYTSWFTYCKILMNVHEHLMNIKFMYNILNIHIQYSRYKILMKNWWTFEEYVISSIHKIVHEYLMKFMTIFMHEKLLKNSWTFNVYILCSLALVPVWSNHDSLLYVCKM